MTDESITLEPIGYVASPVTEPVDEGWGEVVSRIELRPDLADGLTGLDGFTHALVVRGLDPVDGTPVLDIKPYVPAYDRRDAAAVPSGLTDIMRGYLS